MATTSDDDLRKHELILGSTGVPKSANRQKTQHPMQDPMQNKQPATVKRLHLNVSPKSEHDKSPAYVTVTVTPSLVRRIEDLREVVRLHRLNSVCDHIGSLTWGPKEVVDELRLLHSTADITEEAAWFTTWPKHGDACESRAVQINDLRAILDRAPGYTPWLSVQTEKGLEEHWIGQELMPPHNPSLLRQMLVEHGVVPADPDEDASLPEDVLQPDARAARER
jgi:hypothetical protein